ncbi:MAG TPA: TonB-dependent siderophore receptor [Allosphingosinicella sp.]|nr:TonB-dependent siderophore receptor [Allosphingosinicella sp.]
MRSVSIAALVGALSAPAWAADAAAGGAEAGPAESAGGGAAPLQEGGGSSGGVIVVTGTRDEYGVDSTRTATRTDTPLRDVPQAVSVVTERQIDDQAMRSIGDVLRYVPGTMVGQGEGHRDQITIRGNNSTADFFVDGLRDDVQYYRPLYNLQRVEVLRGPNAMIFGRGGGGGVVNRVTKVPVFQPSVGASASLDTFGAWYADADVNQPLSEQFAVRLNAVYEEFANHRDVYSGRLIAANPALRLLPGADTGIGLSYEYVDDERVVDRGIPSAFAGSIANPAPPLAGFRDAFFGVEGVNRMTFAGHIVRGTVEHRFTDDLTLVSRLLYADYDKAYRNAFAATAVTLNEAGARQVGVEAYFDAFQRENLFSQTDLVWNVATGPVAHTLLAGFEYGQQDSANQRVNGFFDTLGTDIRRAIVPLADPISVPAITFRAGPGQRSTASDAEILAFYVQDQARIGPFELVAGLRYDRFRLAVADLFAGTRLARTDDLWSPRLGLIFHPIEPVSVYASYSRSYLPQSGDQFNSLDVSLAALEPERFDNYELGVKWEPRRGLLLSAAAYRLDRTNTRAAGPNPGQTVLTGGQRSRGIELEVAGQIRRNWQVSLGYALQEAEIRRTTTAAPAGREVAQVPRHQASLWTRYDFTRAFGAGVGIHHQSESFASISNAVVLPSYTRVDAALFLRIAEGVEAQLNIENLLDESYFPTAHNDNNITTGAPISARGTLRVSF